MRKSNLKVFFSSVEVLLSLARLGLSHNSSMGGPVLSSSHQKRVRIMSGWDRARFSGTRAIHTGGGPE